MELECSSKLSEQLWTTCEIRACSTDWSLAGDAGLLEHLKKFSQILSDQTHTTEAVVETLLDEIKSTVIRLNNVTNTFLSLTNTQFMENRVYDDDDSKKSPLEDGNSDKVQTKEEQGADVISRMKASVTLGMSVLDAMFDAVDVSDSDSEEESSTSLGHTVFQPRDPYMTRPLPYLIGSKEFIEDDRVGLGELLSDEETSEKHVIHSSSSEATSDIEQDLLDGNKQPEVFVSSESESSEPKSKKHQTLCLDIEVTSHGLEDNIFGQDCSPEAELDLEFPHIAKEGATKNFAAELASKLGKMSSVKIQEKMASTNKKPSNSSIDDLFTVGMESEDEDSLFGKTHGIFSSGNDLFDHLDGEIAGVIATKGRVLIPENENNAILNNSSSPTSLSSGSSSMKKIVPRSENSPDPITISKTYSKEISENATSMPNKIAQDRGLFSDDDIFGDSLNAKETEKEDLFKAPASKVIGNISKSTQRKILPGAVSILGPNNPNLFNGNLAYARHPPSTSESKHSKVAEVPSLKTNGTNSPDKNFGLDPSSSDDQNLATREFSYKSSLLDSKDEALFKTSVSKTHEANVGIKSSDLFKEDGVDDKLFIKPKSSPLCVGGLSEPILNIFKESARQKPLSLFEDSDSGEEELLFSSTSSTSSKSRRSQCSGDLLSTIADRKLLQRKDVHNDNSLFGKNHLDDLDFDIFDEPSSQSGLNTFEKIHNSSTENYKNISSNMITNKDVSSALMNQSGDNFDGTNNSTNIFYSDKQLDIGVNISSSLSKQSLVSSLLPNSSKSKPYQNIFSDIGLFADELDKDFNIFSASPKNSESSPFHKDKNKPSPENSKSSPFHMDKNKPSPENSESSPFHMDKNKPLIVDLEKSLTLLDQGSEGQANNNIKTYDINKPVVAQKPKITSYTETVSKSNKKISKSPPSLDCVFPLNKTGITLKSDSTTETRPQSIIHAENTIQDDGLHKTNNSLHPNNNNELFGADMQETKQNMPSLLNSNLENKLFVVSKPKPPKSLNIRKTTGSLLENTDDVNSIVTGDTKLNSSKVKTKNLFTNPSISLSKSFNLDDADASLNAGNYSDLINTAQTVPTGECFTNSEGISSEKLSKSEHNSPESFKSPELTHLKTKSLRPSPSIHNQNKMAINPGEVLVRTNPPTEKTKPTEAAVNFDKPARIDSILHSAGKDRAKIPIKRRPQSRQARQEALRKDPSEDYVFDDSTLTFPKHSDSSTLEVVVEDFTDSIKKKNDFEATRQVSLISLDNTSNEVTINNRVVEAIPENLVTSPGSLVLNRNTNPLSPSTDEEDFFGVPQYLPSEYGSNKDLIADSNKDLFGDAPMLSPLDFSERKTLFTKDVTYAESSKIEMNKETPKLFYKNEISSSQLSLSKNDIIKDNFIDDSKSDIVTGLERKFKNDDDDDDDANVSTFLSQENLDQFEINTPKENYTEKSQTFQSEVDIQTSSQNNYTISAKHSSHNKTSLLDESKDLLPTQNKNVSDNLFSDNTNTLSTIKSKANVQDTSPEEDLFFSDNPYKTFTDSFDSPMRREAQISTFGSNKLSENESYFPSSEEKSSRSNNKLINDVNDPNVFSSESTKTKPRTSPILVKGLIPAQHEIDSLMEIQSGYKLSECIDHDITKPIVNSTISSFGLESNTSLFGDDTPESDDLFSSFTIPKKKSGDIQTKEKNKLSIFNDDGEDIFSSPSQFESLEARHSGNSSFLLDVKSDTAKPSLTHKKTQSKTVKIQPLSRVTKTESDDKFEDPLMAMKK